MTGAKDLPASIALACKRRLNDFSASSAASAFSGLARALTLEGQFLDFLFQRGHGVIGLGQLRFDIGQRFALFELGNALVHQLLVRGLRFGVFVPLFGQVFQFHGLSFRE